MKPTQISTVASKNKEVVLDNGSKVVLNYILENIDKKLLQHNDGLLQAITIPSSYSLVKKGYVTIVKNQNPYGSSKVLTANAFTKKGYEFVE